MFRSDFRSGGEEGGHCSSGVSFFRLITSSKQCVGDTLPEVERF